MHKPNHPAPHKKPHNLPAPRHPVGEFHNFIRNIWNMLDFPRHGDSENIEPKIDVYETPKEVTVSAELPGISEKDIDVQISTDGYLTISGEKRSETEQKDKNSYFSEISYGMVKRTIPLPWDLDYSLTDASYNDGILKISIPKTPQAQEKVKKINVKKK